jgi:hypothetical protein
MFFLEKIFPKPDPMARIFRPDSAPYKIDLYFIKPFKASPIKINLRER